jgi:hypothetical protein
MSISARHASLGGNTPDFFQAVCQPSANVENPQFSIHVQTDAYRNRHFLYMSLVWSAVA